MDLVKKYKITILAVILILGAILMPGDDIPSVGIPNIDKVIHLGMFGFLTVCFLGEYFWNNKNLPKLLIPWIALEGFAGSTEIMQLFASGRGCDIKDFIADSIGILLAIIVMRWMINKYGSKVLQHKKS